MGIFVSGIRKFILVINVIIGFITIVSALGGYFNPEEYHAIPAILAMTFPLWAVVTIGMIFVDLFFYRKGLLIQLVVVIFSASGFYSICPLGLGREKPKTADEQESQFTILSYNVYQFVSYDEDNLSPYETMREIYESDADIVCLQEGGFRFKSLKNRLGNDTIRSVIVDSLAARYPTIIISRPPKGFALYSKYPCDTLLMPALPGTSGAAVNYRIDVNGKILSIYNIHLESIGLEDDDKELYLEITDGRAGRKDVGKVKSQLLSKLEKAFVVRSEQASAIRMIMDMDTCGAKILCGDFNDITGCHAMRIMMKDNFLYDTYIEAGIGPCITYRDDRFYFHIDHLLYSRALCPMDYQVISGGASDHLPVKAKFFFKQL